MMILWFAFKKEIKRAKNSQHIFRIVLKTFQAVENRTRASVPKLKGAEGVLNMF